MRRILWQEDEPARNLNITYGHGTVPYQKSCLFAVIIQYGTGTSTINWIPYGTVPVPYTTIGTGTVPYGTVFHV
jgi:hypothetical protein